MTYRVAHCLKTGVATAAILAQLAIGPANAFCGFYVAQADSKLFNKSSKVILARDGDQTAITMASDFEGDVKQFAVVVPVPTFIERKQIGVVDPKTIDHLDHYTAPRLVEYHDDDPCQRPMMTASVRGPPPDNAATGRGGGLQGSSSRYSTRRGAVNASRWSIVAISTTPICLRSMKVGTGTTMANSFGSPW